MVGALENDVRDVTTSRWKIRYHDVGAGPVVILLHGSGPGATGWSNFAPNIAALARNHRVVAMDFPGWGGSDPLDATGQHLLLAITDAVRLLMDELGVVKAALIGNSLGGMAVQMFASLYPDRITHLITMGAPAPDGPPTFSSPGGVSEGLKVLFGTYQDPSVDAFRRLVNIMVFDLAFATDALVTERQKNALQWPEHLARFPANVAAMGGLSTPEIRDLGAKLSASAVPALIVHGRDDRVINVENSLRTAAMMPNSTLVVFNRCGHWAQLEHAERFNALVSAFLATPAA